jgi:hypothetical protein
VEGVTVVGVPFGASAVGVDCCGGHAEGVIVVGAVVVAALDATPVVVGVVVTGAVVMSAVVAAGGGANFTSNITKMNVIANINIGIIRSPHATISALCILSQAINDTEMSPSTKCSGIFARFPEKISLTSIPAKRANVIIAG